MQTSSALWRRLEENNSLLSFFFIAWQLVFMTQLELTRERFLFIEQLPLLYVDLPLRFRPLGHSAWVVLIVLFIRNSLNNWMSFICYYLLGPPLCMLCGANTVYVIRFLGCWLLCMEYSIQFSIILTKFHYLHYVKKRKKEKKISFFIWLRKWVLL